MTLSDPICSRWRRRWWRLWMMLQYLSYCLYPSYLWYRMHHAHLWWRHDSRVVRQSVHVLVGRHWQCAVAARALASAATA